MAVIALAITGMGIASKSGLNTQEATFLLTSLHFQPVRTKEYCHIFLLMLIRAHIGVWAFHQFIKKDKLCPSEFLETKIAPAKLIGDLSTSFSFTKKFLQN